MLKHMFIRSLALVVLLTGLHGMACAAASTLERVQQRGTLILGTSGNMPSMSQAGPDGKVSGFDIDLASIMADAMGVKLIIEVMTFAELLPALESGKVDAVISNLTITPKRNLRVAFVGPYLISGKCIVTKSETLAKAEQLGDLNNANTKLAVLGGSTSEDFVRGLFPAAAVVKIDDYAKGADLVATDRVNGMLTDYPICLATLKAYPDAGFSSVFSRLTYEPIGIALPAGDAQFINWTENFLDRMDGTNGIEELGQRWFGLTTFNP